MFTYIQQGRFDGRQNSIRSKSSKLLSAHVRRHILSAVSCSTENKIYTGAKFAPGYVAVAAPARRSNVIATLYMPCSRVRMAMPGSSCVTF